MTSIARRYGIQLAILLSLAGTGCAATSNTASPDQIETISVQDTLSDQTSSDKHEAPDTQSKNEISDGQDSPSFESLPDRQDIQTAENIPDNLGKQENSENIIFGEVTAINDSSIEVAIIETGMHKQHNGQIPDVPGNSQIPDNAQANGFDSMPSDESKNDSDTSNTADAESQATLRQDREQSQPNQNSDSREKSNDSEKSSTDMNRHGKGKHLFNETGEAITIDITEVSIFNDEDSEELAVGDIVEIEKDESGNIISVTVKTIDRTGKDNINDNSFDTSDTTEL